MHTFIAAGGIPEPDDPLYEVTRGAPKAFLKIAGRPMIQWILDALSSAELVDDVFIIAPPYDSVLDCSKPIYKLDDQGGLLDNVLYAMHAVRDHDPAATHALYVSADIPAITGEMVDWRIRAASDDPSDLDYAAVERSVMEARFPRSNRSYVKLRDVEVCGGDMNVIRLELAVQTELWDRVVATRKSPLRQAALLGFDTLLLLLFRRLTLKEGEKRASRGLGLDGRVRLCPYAEVAMDIDKPHQLEILDQDLRRQAAAAP